MNELVRRMDSRQDAWTLAGADRQWNDGVVHETHQRLRDLPGIFLGALWTGKLRNQVPFKRDNEVYWKTLLRIGSKQHFLVFWRLARPQYLACLPTAIKLKHASF